MRNSGNIQQQSLMPESHPISRQINIGLLTALVLFTTACTRMPIAHSQLQPQPAVAGKMQLVGQTGIGSTARYIDSNTGATVNISVLSEYFSASGRKCRRYLEGSDAFVDRALVDKALADKALVDNAMMQSEMTSGQSIGKSEFSVSTSQQVKKRLACQDSHNGWVDIQLQSITG